VQLKVRIRLYKSVSLSYTQAQSADEEHVLSLSVNAEVGRSSKAQNGISGHVKHREAPKHQKAQEGKARKIATEQKERIKKVHSKALIVEERTKITRRQKTQDGN
jgi:hypothetical protein